MSELETKDPIRTAQLFLNSRSTFKSLIPKSKFTSILYSIDDSISEEAIDDLYEAFTTQNNKRLKESNYRVRTRLENFTITKDSMTEDEDSIQLQDADRDTLDTIMIDLEKLNDHISDEVEKLERNCDDILKDINESVDDLSDLKYGKLDFMSTISESIESLDKLESKLLTKIPNDN